MMQQSRNLPNTEARIRRAEERLVTHDGERDLLRFREHLLGQEVVDICLLEPVLAPVASFSRGLAETGDFSVARREKMSLPKARAAHTPGMGAAAHNFRLKAGNCCKTAVVR
jgi:hypothetical protein